MGLAAMMAVQTPALAAETSQEAATQELQTTETQAAEVQTAEAQPEESLAEEVETEVTQTEESQLEEVAEVSQTQEPETAETLQAEAQEQEIVTEASIEELIDQYALAETQETLTDGWHQDDNGNYIYVKDGEVLKNCVVKIGDSYYGFSPSGERYTDTWFAIVDDETGERDDYRAKEDGSLYINEWYQGDYGNRYYYGSDGKTYSGVQEIDGQLYVFWPSGSVYRNTIVLENGKNYYCDENGYATELTNNGWTEIDGKYFYVQDGKALQNCVAQIGNSYYGFDSKGRRYTDTEFSVRDYETETSSYYRAKEDGSLYVNEWYTTYRWKYYYGEGGKAVSGLQVVEGKQYIFMYDGELYTNTAILVDGSNYYCDSEGTVTKLENNGWILIDGSYFYIADGVLLRHCIVQIGNAYYGFDSYGKMYEDCQFDMWSATDGGYYRARANGALYVNEWYTADNGDLYYYGEGGKAGDGFLDLNGNKYYLKYGKAAQNKCLSIDGIVYVFGADAVSKIAPDNSWVEINGDYYYVRNGELLIGVAKFGDFYYGFDSNGKMYANDRFEI